MPKILRVEENKEHQCRPAAYSSWIPKLALENIAWLNMDLSTVFVPCPDEYQGL